MRKQQLLCGDTHSERPQQADMVSHVAAQAEQGRALLIVTLRPRH